MTVRPMLPTDVDPVIEIADCLANAPRWSRDLYEAALNPHSAPQRLALVAQESSGRVVGFSIAALVLDEAELESIAVSPDRQRQGIARAMLQELCRRLAERGANKVILEVRESNVAAQNFYRSGGFEVIGHRPGYYIDPKEDAILMAISLRS